MQFPKKCPKRPKKYSGILDVRLFPCYFSFFTLTPLMLCFYVGCCKKNLKIVAKNTKQKSIHFLQNGHFCWTKKCPKLKNLKISSNKLRNSLLRYGYKNLIGFWKAV
jgi:hypothetical protein